MTKLSVNINKVAVIRNSRGGNNPDILKVAADCERFGADGITVHPRPDERHIRYSDVYALKKLVTTEFNIEGYPDHKFIDMVKKVVPHQVTLVPDPPNALTSDAGWDTKEHFVFLKDIVAEFKPLGIRVSIFTSTDVSIIEHAKKLGADRVELYTGPYAHRFLANKQESIAPYVIASECAKKNELGLNAGHDLSLENLKFLKQQLLCLDEVSIGHALICDALYYGLENTIQMYKRLVQ